MTFDSKTAQSPKKAGLFRALKSFGFFGVQKINNTLPKKRLNFNMRITINGTPGSGKGTVSKYLAKKFRLKHYDIGEMRREMAKKEGMSIWNLNKLGEKEAWTDRLVDNFQKKLRKKENILVDGRLAWHFIPNSIKILLTVKPEIGAKRIMKSRRKEEKYRSIKEGTKAVKERLKSDIKRYKKYYGIKNLYDLRNYDIIIDTSKMSIKQMKKAVERAVLRYQNKNLLR